MKQFFLKRSFLVKILLSLFIFILPLFENTSSAASYSSVSHLSVKKKKRKASKSNKKKKSGWKKRKAKNKRKKTTIIKSKPSNKVNFPFR